MPILFIYLFVLHLFNILSVPCAILSIRTVRNKIYLQGGYNIKTNKNINGYDTLNNIIRYEQSALGIANCLRKLGKS